MPGTEAQFDVSIDDMLIEYLFKETIPDTVKALEAYSSVQEAAKKLYSRVVELGYLDARELNDSAVLAFVCNIGSYFRVQKRSVALDQARQAVVDNSFQWVQLEDYLEAHSKKQLSKAEVFHLKVTSRLADTSPLRRVSEGTYRLVSTLYDAILTYLDSRTYNNTSRQDGKDESSSVFFDTARDITYVFLAVMPVYWGSHFLEKVPWATIVFHNDCEYLAFHLNHLHSFVHMKLRAMGFECQLTLVDLVAPVKDIGKRYFVDQLRSKADELMEEVERTAPLFVAVEDDDRHESLVRETTRCLETLVRLSKSWQEV